MKLNLKLFAELFNEHQGVDENNGFNRQRFTLNLIENLKTLEHLESLRLTRRHLAIKNSKSIVGFKYTYRLNLTK